LHQIGRDWRTVESADASTKAIGRKEYDVMGDGAVATMENSIRIEFCDLVFCQLIFI
jgi:hypothetical protein